MKTYIENFCNEYEYPQEATDFLLNAYDKVTQFPAVEALFTKYLISYKENGMTQYAEALQQLQDNAPLCEVHYYTLHFLFLICMTKELKNLYQAHEIPENIRYDSIKDLTYKLFECHKVYGIWGTFVASWFQFLFGLRLYALGRLQFEVGTAGIDYHKDGNDINPTDTILGVHIPSSGPLNHDACMESYQMAKQFFSKLFEGKKTVYRCHSWLLYPEHPKFLPSHSNILKFAEDFILYEQQDSTFEDDLWRFFDKVIHTVDDFEEPKNSLQKAYIDWLRQGNKTGTGIGLIFL